MSHQWLQRVVLYTWLLWTVHADKHRPGTRLAAPKADGCEVGEKYEIREPPIYSICLHPEGDMISDFIRSSGHWMDCDEYPAMTMEGVLLDIGRSAELGAAVTGLRRLSASSALSHYLSGVVVDVGANIGSCAFDLAQLGHRVYAFEFQRDNYERMRSTKKLNNFKGGIDIFNVLVSSESKPHITVASDINSKNMGAQGAREVSRSLLGVKQQVSLSAMRLDDAVNRHVNFMKLDCQGCEYAALLGAEKIFQDHGVDLLYMEFSPPSMASASGKPKAAEDTLHMLLKYGMDIWVRNHKYVSGKGMTTLNSTADVLKFMKDAPFKVMPDEEMDVYAIRSGTIFPSSILGMIS
ncbi:g7297 [Coccomyxa viridis]|uniref:G7297 protein n=1 Tax=Coccomyxa viridis TaxID=1274662 RepID=A0ABP1FXI1_9CHLO